MTSSRPIDIPLMRMKRTTPSIAMLLFIGSAWACGGEDRGLEDGSGPSDDVAEHSTSAPDSRPDAAPGSRPDVAPEAGLRAERRPTPTVANAPEGGLEQWAVDVRRVLEEIELDPRTSDQKVVDLHEGLYRYFVLFYGAGGVLTGDDHPELAAAVAEMDPLFQRLRDLTSATEMILRESILGAIHDIRMQLATVLELARSAGIATGTRQGY